MCEAMTPSMDIEDVLTWAFRDQNVEHSAEADPDAVRVYWAVLALPPAHAGIIRHFARLAERPDWHTRPARMVVLSHVRRSRRLYTEWVRAMMVLQRTLDRTLSSVAVTGPALAAEPWLLERKRA